MTETQDGCVDLLRDFRIAFSSKSPFPTRAQCQAKCPKCVVEFENLSRKFTYGNLTKVANCIDSKIPLPAVSNTNTPFVSPSPLKTQQPISNASQLSMMVPKVPSKQQLAQELEATAMVAPKTLTDTLKTKSMEKWPTWLIFIVYIVIIIIAILVLVFVFKSPNAPKFPGYNHKKHLIAETINPYVAPSVASTSTDVQDIETPRIKAEGIPVSNTGNI